MKDILYIVHTCLFGKIEIFLVWYFSNESRCCNGVSIFLKSHTIILLALVPTIKISSLTLIVYTYIFVKLIKLYNMCLRYKCCIFYFLFQQTSSICECWLTGSLFLGSHILTKESQPPETKMSRSWLYSTERTESSWLPICSTENNEACNCNVIVMR